VLASLGSLLLVSWLAKMAWGEKAAPRAAVVLATCYLFWDKARTAQADALLCFFVLAAITSFASWRAGLLGGRSAGLLFWLAAAAAVLTKGPVGLILPVGVALGTLAWDRNLRAARLFAPVAGPLLASAIVGAWALPASSGIGGSYSVLQALRQHVLDRAIHGMHHVQPFWYYLAVVPVQALPWSPMIPGAVWAAWRERENPWSRLFLWQAVFVLLFFSLWTEKRDLYVLPAYPALALLVARLFERGRPALSEGWVLLPLRLLSVAMLAGAPIAWVVLSRFGAIPARVGLQVAAALACGGLAVGAASFGRKAARAVWIVAGAVGAAYLVVAQVVEPAINELKSARRFALELARRTESHRGRGHGVYAYRLGNLPRAIAFYTDGLYLEELFGPEELLAAIGDAGESFVVTHEEELGGWPQDLRERAEILLAHALARTRLCLVRLHPRSLPGGEFDDRSGDPFHLRKDEILELRGVANEGVRRGDPTHRRIELRVELLGDPGRDLGAVAPG
jgi:hypothetical protein